jgi:hypothetical protein
MMGPWRPKTSTNKGITAYILYAIAFFLSPNSILAAKHGLSSFRTFLSLFSSSHYSSTFHLIIAAPTTSKPFIGM